MALYQNTVENVFTPVLTNTATATAIASSAVANLGTVTVRMPGKTSILSAHVEVWWRDAFAAAANVSVQRVGVQVNGGAVNNLDFAYTAIANTGDPEANVITRNITSLLGAVGTSFTLTLQFAMATSVAQNINNIQGKVYVTYQFDDTGLTEFVQTITIPIQGDLTTIPTAGTYQQIGTTGTGAAAVNQIPQLTGVGGLLEGYGAGLIIDQQWIEVYSQDAGAAATNFNATYRFDGAGTTYARATLVQTLNGSAQYVDFFETTALGLATTAAHAFEMTTSLSARFSCTSALYRITIRWDPTAADYTSHLNSIRMPLPGDFAQVWISGTTAADKDLYTTTLYIEEPGTITARQSGVFFQTLVPTGATVNFAFPNGGVTRPYAPLSLLLSGPFTLVRNGTWTPVRGVNTLSTSMFTSTALNARACGGFFYLNYQSGIRTEGGVKMPWKHNKSLCFMICDAPTTGAVPTRRQLTSGYTTPTLTSPWFLNAWAIEGNLRTAAGIDANVMVENTPGGSGGWTPRTLQLINDGELGPLPYITSLAPNARVSSTGLGGTLDPTVASRDFQIITTSGASSMFWHWITAHHCTFEAAVTSTGFTGDGSGIAVDVYSSTAKTLAGSGTTAVGGSVTITLFDDATTYFAEAEQSGTQTARSADTTPSSPP